MRACVFSLAVVVFVSSNVVKRWFLKHLGKNLTKKITQSGDFMLSLENVY